MQHFKYGHFFGSLIMIRWGTLGLAKRRTKAWNSSKSIRMFISLGKHFLLWCIHRYYTKKSIAKIPSDWKRKKKMKYYWSGRALAYSRVMCFPALQWQKWRIRMERNEKPLFSVNSCDVETFTGNESHHNARIHFRLLFDRRFSYGHKFKRECERNWLDRNWSLNVFLRDRSNEAEREESLRHSSLDFQLEFLFANILFNNIHRLQHADCPLDVCNRFDCDEQIIATES